MQKYKLVGPRVEATGQGRVKPGLEHRAGGVEVCSYPPHSDVFAVSLGRWAGQGVCSVQAGKGGRRESAGLNIEITYSLGCVELVMKAG